MTKSNSYKGVNRILIHDTELVLGAMLNSKKFPESVVAHLKALRVEDDEEIEILNGRGQVARALFKKSGVEILSVGSREHIKPVVHLYLSPPKGDDFTSAVSQATEMGVEKIFFLRTQHNQYPKAAEPWTRAERISQAAQEQCALAWSTKIESDWRVLEKVLKTAENPVFCDESSIVGSDGMKWLGKKPSLEKPVSLFVGPEGGWSQEELTLLSQWAVGLCLGPNILKVPTAIVAAVTLLRS